MRGLKLKRVTYQDRNVLNKIKDVDSKLWQDGGINDWLLMPLVESGLVLIFELNKKMVGYALLYREVEDRNIVFLYDFVILPLYQGKGLGKKFFRMLIEYLWRNSLAQKLELTVSPFNQAALRIYHKLYKMKKKKIIKDFYGPGEDRWWLAGDLQEMIKTSC